MNLLYIENKLLLGKIITYLKKNKTPFTTNLDDNIENVLFAEVTPRIIKKMEDYKSRGKNIIFVLYLEEKKIYIQSKLNNKNSKIYMEKINQIITLSDKVITSLPFYKNLLGEKVNVIEHEIEEFNITKQTNETLKKYSLKRRKKKILIFDFDYHYLDYIEDVVEKYPKLEYIYLGLKPNYLLSLKLQNKLQKLEKKVNFIQYYNSNNIIEFIQISDMILNFEDINLDIKYIYIIFLLKKELVMKQSSLYEDYLVNSKNIYTFKTKDGLLKKLNKIEHDRLSNLTDNAYDITRNCKEIEILKKWKELLQ